GCGTMERRALACHAASVVRDGEPGGCRCILAPLVPSGRLAGHASTVERKLAFRTYARLSANLGRQIQARPGQRAVAWNLCRTPRASGLCTPGKSHSSHPGIWKVGNL